MKNVILSADGERKVYSVPDEVAQNLEKYCLDFCDRWIHSNPNAKKFRTKYGVCYDETDFIEYLNTWIFPSEPSVLIENLGFIDIDKTTIPKEYKNCPYFNF